MPVEAVVLDIGGVLELTPPTGWPQRWAAELGLPLEMLGRRLDDIGRAGSLGGAPAVDGQLRPAEPVLRAHRDRQRAVPEQRVAAVDGHAQRAARK